MTSDVALLSLHGLRLKGFAETSDVADLYGLDPAALALQLDAQAAASLVVHRPGRPAGWRLTPAGRAENERLLAAELAGCSGADAVRTAYATFRRLNGEVLAACTRWQVRDVGRGILNDHADPGYDRAVIDDLLALDRLRRPVTDALGAALDRFGIHGPRLGEAAERVERGETDWFARPLLASYHTVWFELHEDLLATLGLDRATETAADDSARQGVSAPRHC